MAETFVVKRHSALVAPVITMGVATIAMSLLTNTAVAQHGGQRVALEEIIVTANKRESALLETAAAVSAFDASTLQQLGIQNALDIVAHTPSLSITPNKISIRGVGRPNNALGSDPGVGVYWDGVYNTENGIFRYANFFDIERIEVLRGPQGTLYGGHTVREKLSRRCNKPYQQDAREGVGRGVGCRTWQL